MIENIGEKGEYQDDQQYSGVFILSSAHTFNLE